ncbi:VWA domain-containing protein [Corynebacterium lipophiloflavum]|uniref:von Willebrand factor type A domain protein n=1 Tax=Corynebacterium lipophiloflavum (strain ATCC 700352 / DSM 44291 / CCUG 37336 / JCM 10383 / DMMZ 1944) TaxID=525263 RepID=C0XT56_CORLD|nr:VWA domain-containing protein [Corynebacterium lipophiloflavum]EEI16595.1 von Willebrand factor type A domain protein [Corynebacterium lipophiloflavum DSM 44291]
MARHASGKNNYALSGGVIAALVAAVLLIGALVAFVATRGESDAVAVDESPACVAGELSLPVAATDAAVATSLIDAYASANPVVRDFCITPTLVESIADAAVYIAPNTPVAHQELAAENRTAATSEPSPIYAEKVGLAGVQAPESAASVELGAVAFPVDDEPSASALVASALAASDQDAVNALTNQRVATLDDAQESAEYIATTESSVPEGLSFSPLDASIVYSAIPLNQGDNVTEEQSRAGQDFVRVAAENFSAQPVDQPTISDLVWAAATPGGGEEITRNTETGATIADGGPTNTLFLLDTSEAMAPYIDVAAEGIAAAAQSVAGAGHQVALWNYSSPLSPGVTLGYRRNVTFTPDAGEVVQSVNRFLTGGQPQTREAVTAAVGQAAEAQLPSRVVVVTTGTADGGDDEAFARAVTDAAGADVSVSVVHVGEGQQDQALRGVSSSAADAPRQEQVADAIKAAARFTP